MKTKRFSAAMTALLCAASTGIFPQTMLTNAEEIQNRDRVYESSLILPEEFNEVWEPLRAYLWDSEHNTPTMDAYTARTQDGMIEVVCGTEEILETVRAFVRDNELNENLIVYRIETPEERQMDGETGVTMTAPAVPDTPETTGTTVAGDIKNPVPVYQTADELETLVQIKKALDNVLYQNGFTGTKNDEDSAYVTIFWGSRTVTCNAKSEEAAAEIRTLMQENEIPEALVTLKVLPEFDYRQYDGGQRSYEEINSDAIFMYLNLKKHLQEDGILSNICLTMKMHEDQPEIPYTAIDIAVKTQEDADALNDYMREKAYWTAIITVTVQPDLSAAQESAAGFQAYVCMDGDSNDDGNFSIADIIKLDRYLIADGTMNLRQATASDLNKNGLIDAGDMTLSKRMMMQTAAK